MRPEAVDRLKRSLRRAAGTTPLVLSAVTGAGVDKTLRALAGEIAAAAAPVETAAGGT